MSQEGVESFLGRVITDTVFRELVITASLEEACHSRGLSVTSTEMRYLKELDLSRFAEIAQIIDGSIRRN